MYQPCPVTVTLYLQSGVHNELQTDILQSLISWKSSNVCKAIIHEIEAEQQGFSEMYGRIGPQYETDQPSGSRTITINLHCYFVIMTMSIIEYYRSSHGSYFME